MKRQVALNRALYVFSGVVAAAVPLVLLSYGQTEAAIAIAGVIVGAAATAIPQAIARRTERLHRTRAAAVLFRSELYAYQDWIRRSLRETEWAPRPKDIATSEHLTDLAYAMHTWERWQPLGQARRYSNHLVGLSEKAPPNDESRKHARQTFAAINRAIVQLSQVDDGPDAARPVISSLARVPRFRRKSSDDAPMV